MLPARAYSKDFLITHTASGGARAYNGGLGAETPAGSMGHSRAGNGSMGHGSNGSRKSDGSHGSWVTRC